MEKIDWSNLKFGYIPTNYNVRCYYRNGKWGEIEVSSETTINIHMAATCLHYGQEAFEGLKAHGCKDGKIRIFRMRENAKRLQSTCRGILMAEPPVELFEKMVVKAVELNREFVPPYGHDASLYIRPLLIGTSAQVGVHPSTEYLLIIFVTPVGPYFKGGFASSNYVIIREYDRAAPLGTGRYKVGGNYAASLMANKIAHDGRQAKRTRHDAAGKCRDEREHKGHKQNGIPVHISPNVQAKIDRAARALRACTIGLPKIRARHPVGPRPRASPF